MLRTMWLVAIAMLLGVASPVWAVGGRGGGGFGGGGFGGGGFSGGGGFHGGGFSGGGFQGGGFNSGGFGGGYRPSGQFGGGNFSGFNNAGFNAGSYRPPMSMNGGFRPGSFNAGTFNEGGFNAGRNNFSGINANNSEFRPSTYNFGGNVGIGGAGQQRFQNSSILSGQTLNRGNFAGFGSSPNLNSPQIREFGAQGAGQHFGGMQVNQFVPNRGGAPRIGGDAASRGPGAAATRPGATVRPGSDAASRGPVRPGVRPGGNAAGVRPNRPSNRPTWPTNDSALNRPQWANGLRPNQINDINRNWNSALRPDRAGGSVQNWATNHPNRVNYWNNWGRNVRPYWANGYRPPFDNRWWNNHWHDGSCWWHYHYWNHNYPWTYWWGVPVWDTFADWYGPTWDDGYYYDYGPGGNVVYEDNNVVINGETVATTQEFAQSAAALAVVPKPESEEQVEQMQWMPLGTFAISMNPQDTDPSRVIQLAVAKNGVIAGTLFNKDTDQSSVVEGQVDKQTQRAAFRLGDQGNIVVETGLYNLTQNSAPILVHYGDTRTETGLLVRMAPPTDGDSATGTNTNTDSNSGSSSTVEDF